MKNIWLELFRLPVIVIAFAYLTGFGFFYGCASAARMLGVTVVLGFEP